MKFKQLCDERGDRVLVEVCGKITETNPIAGSADLSKYGVPTRPNPMFFELLRTAQLVARVVRERQKGEGINERSNVPDPPRHCTRGLGKIGPIANMSSGVCQLAESAYIANRISRIYLERTCVARNRLLPFAPLSQNPSKIEVGQRVIRIKLQCLQKARFCFLQSALFPENVTKIVVGFLEGWLKLDCAPTASLRVLRPVLAQQDSGKIAVGQREIRIK